MYGCQVSVFLPLYRRQAHGLLLSRKLHPARGWGGGWGWVRYILRPLNKIFPTIWGACLCTLYHSVYLFFCTKVKNCWTHLIWIHSFHNENGWGLNYIGIWSWDNLCDETFPGFMCKSTFCKISLILLILWGYLVPQYDLVLAGPWGLF